MEVNLRRVPDGTPVTIFANMIIGTTFLPASHAVGVIVTGGGTIPVEGKEEDILKLIRVARSAPVANPPTKEKNNGIKKRK